MARPDKSSGMIAWKMDGLRNETMKTMTIDQGSVIASSIVGR
jgi:hypothetical protein